MAGVRRVALAMLLALVPAVASAHRVGRGVIVVPPVVVAPYVPPIYPYPWATYPGPYGYAPPVYGYPGGYGGWAYGPWYGWGRLVPGFEHPGWRGGGEYEEPAIRGFSLH